MRFYEGVSKLGRSKTDKFNTKADQVFTMDSRSLIENAR